MHLKKYYLFLFVFFSWVVFAQGEDEPVEWSTTVERISATEAVLHFTAAIKEKWHLYSLKEFEDGPLPTEFTYVYDSLRIKLKGEMQSDPPKIEFDQIFEIDLPFFEKEAKFSQGLTLLDTNVDEIRGEINYQACDDRVCIFRTEPFAFSLNGKAIVQSAIEITQQDKARSAALTLSLKNKALLTSGLVDEGDASPLLNLFLLGFLGGLIALLTPCVFPMIPLTVSFFLKQGTSLRKGIFNALLYGGFIVVIYVLLSLPFHFLDSLNPEILNSISTNVPLNLLFFGVFVFFAFSFFGFYELTLPSSWGNSTDESANLKGIAGIFFYGANPCHCIVLLYGTNFRISFGWFTHLRRWSHATYSRNDWFWSSPGFTFCLVCSVPKCLDRPTQIGRMDDYSKSCTRLF